MPQTQADNLLQEPVAAQAARVPAGWQPALQAAAAELARVAAYVEQRRAAGAAIYPASPFKALEYTEPGEVRVVILGQDPYHGCGQAQGLAFSVPDGCPRPPSLRNIFKELADDYARMPGGEMPAAASAAPGAQPAPPTAGVRTPFPGPALHAGVQGVLDLDTRESAAIQAGTQAAAVATGPAPYQADPSAFSNDLTRWARQGVLLLNTALTVEDGKPASHARQGWEAVTDALIALVARDPAPKVFMLWGAHAQAKQALLPAASGHLVLSANHPSPLSARRPPVPFLGCGHFRRANEWLVSQGRRPVDWFEA